MHCGSKKENHQGDRFALNQNPVKDGLYGANKGLPARLRDAGDFPTQRHLTELDAADAEFAHISAAAAGELAAVVATNLELRFLLLFNDPACLSHKEVR